MAFRLNPNYINSRVQVREAVVNVSTNAEFYMYLVKNPTFDATFSPTWKTLPGSSLQYDNEWDDDIVDVTNLIDNNIFVASGNRARDKAGGLIETLDYLGSDADGTPELWVIAVKSATSNEIANLVTVNFIEYL